MEVFKITDLVKAKPKHYFQHSIDICSINIKKIIMVVLPSISVINIGMHQIFFWKFS